MSYPPLIAHQSFWLIGGEHLRKAICFVHYPAINHPSASVDPSPKAGKSATSRKYIGGMGKRPVERSPRRADVPLGPAALAYRESGPGGTYGPPRKAKPPKLLEGLAAVSVDP